MRALIPMLGVAMMAAACAPAPVDPSQSYFAPNYRGIETRRLDDELVSFLVRMEGARTNADVADYAKCAAAQYALIRGFGFARHVRTSVQEEGGLWVGDAVYTISAALPKGLQTIDAEVVVSECAETGIPTV
ncbi:hypothetical protein C8N43_1213 [Litoreibacter ponti]|uniref:Lipoprotein n=1 Tax=Litoreibacter ponti TaxID=1510457 RepID=A0A2T6BKG8_9RHOB|nr:hypothetical protein [Litoreibacter ponti]PTX56554.1 hypothetical protein C8N43_1213 [Litoreibacter ponti]